jgi:hypothetical protein
LVDLIYHVTEGELTMIFTASLITAASIESPLPSTTALDPIFKESFQPAGTPRQYDKMIVVRQKLE